MSSYLNFYLVPKATKKKYDGDKEEVVNLTQEPLLLMSYSRSCDIYEAFDVLSPAYSGFGCKYTELTKEKADHVVSEYEKSVKATEKRLAISYKMLKEGGYHAELWTDIQTAEEYLEEQKAALEELKFIAYLIGECTESWSNFEKVLINIG